MCKFLFYLLMYKQDQTRTKQGCELKNYIILNQIRETYTKACIFLSRTSIFDFENNSLRCQLPTPTPGSKIFMTPFSDSDYGVYFSSTPTPDSNYGVQFFSTSTPNSDLRVQYFSTSDSASEIQAFSTPTPGFIFLNSFPDSDLSLEKCQLLSTRPSPLTPAPNPCY